MQVDEDNAWSGDSGGPWYSVNTAYGIHSRSSCIGYCAPNSGQSWFSAVRYLDDAVDAFVMTD